MSISPKSRNLIVLALLAVVAWVFWGAVWMAPLRILVVVFHEAGHALMAVLTGGSVEGIQVGMNEGGRTMTRGGSTFLILNGGYLGSLVTGIALLAAVQKPGRGRFVAAGLGVLLLIITLVWFRPILSFGFLYAGTMGFLLVLLGALAPPWFSDGFVRFLGLFSALYALADIQSDVFRLGFFGGSWYADGPIVTDAHMLAELTLIPSPVWGIGWLVIGVATLWLTRRWTI